MIYVIYTKANCHYCVKAKDWLKKNEMRYEEISLDDPEILQLFKQAHPDIKSVPAVFDADGNLIVQWKT